MTDQKKMCWEVKNCNVKHKCPAYPNDGRICFSVSKTLCGGKTQAGFIDKRAGCAVCSFKMMLDSDI